MKPYMIAKDIFAALIFIGLLYLINSVEPFGAVISNIISNSATAKTALVILTAVFVIRWFTLRFLKRIGGKYYNLMELIKRY